MACRDAKKGKIFAYLGSLAVVLFLVFQGYQMVASLKQATEKYEYATETHTERILRQSE